MATVHQPLGPQPGRILTSTVLGVTLRVAGAVTTEVHPFAIGTPEQQVTARLGDALIYICDPELSDRIRAHWDSAILAAHKLPSRVSQTWLVPQPGTYPLTIAARLTDQLELSAASVPADRASHTPAHLRMRVDRLVWQVCDRDSWRALADAWYQIHRHLSSG
ncbi:MAG: hypothetical protein GEV09_01190 [Pseudonocardiaceae bacterium]|nr:hypothetical protein [Pseudonocardiaceae bacterium]